MLYSADEAVSATTITLGVIGVVLALPAFALFLVGAYRIFRLVAAGTPLPGRLNRPWRRLGTLLVQTFGHTKMFKRPLIGAAHLAVMFGFLFGIIVWFEAFLQVFHPAGGWPWLSEWPVYHFVEEILGLATVLGILLLIGVRLTLGASERTSRFYNSNMVPGYLIEAVVLLSGLGMLLVKATKIATFGGGSLWADFFTVHLAKLLPASPVLVSAIALLKLLSGMIFLVFVGINLTWGVAWHRFTAYFNIFFQRNPDGTPANGKLKPMTGRDGLPVTLDNVADDTLTGVGHLSDASWKMLLDTTTCTECGRCQDLCPAWNTGKPLSPKKFIMDIRDAAVANADLLRDPTAAQPQNDHAGVDVLKLAGEGGLIEDDVLWSCTNCGACVDQCPVDIEHIDHIADLRRFQVLADADFPSELAGMFTNIENKGNPWGRNNSERAQWVAEARRDGIDVPVFGEDVHDFADTEYLFWVGCAGAYDEQGRRTSRAVVDLLHTAGVKYLVLSTGETCTGDPARRAGNEFLFQMQAAQNIETLDGVFTGVPAGQRKIITTCPHCFNTIRNEYPDFDGHYDVFHHTQLLNRLVRDKWLTPIPRTPEQRKPITYHDPCFLGRHNQVFDPPRELLGATGIELREMDKSHNEAFCCGAGGARMFMEEDIGRRVNEFRTEQALDTGAEEIATACPFCTTMFDGGVKALSQDSAGPRPEVRDVALRLRESVLVDGQLPEPRTKAFLTTPQRLELTLPPAQEPDVTEQVEATTAKVTEPPAVAPTPTPTSAPMAGPPGVPDVPTAPGAPAVPGAPGVPGAPTSVGIPAAPGVPGVPTAPGAPAAPAAPAIPAAPGTDPARAESPAAPPVPP
ncbi:MAG TPA: heterodisulfide reductase-related iron-sulfur binding cluster, partial [Corynebacterium sp.]|nr:heterodisulfide reductase-related iron-sulfur binding cluster [Corynebacterium sp.]